eukprot:2370161-Rhodomonas_salina.1
MSGSDISRSRGTRCVLCASPVLTSHMVVSRGTRSYVLPPLIVGAALLGNLRFSLSPTHVLCRARIATVSPVHSAFCVRTCYAMPGTDVACGTLRYLLRAVGLCAAYAMPGSDRGYGTTRPPKLTSFGRGYGPRVHSAVRASLLLMLAGLLVTLLLNWSAAVRATKAVM